ncbi:MAG: hypothetical protein J6U01_01030 [Clostridia bacterium]|nr:hypothetical protein [Clostridia bacterium]
MAQNVIINGVTYAEVPEVDIPKAGGGTAKFYDASGADAAAGNVLDGKKFVGSSGLDTGSMANNGSVSGEIETKAGTVTIPAGYTSGGTVGIKASAVSDLTSATLLQGKEVLGVQGTLALPTISQDSTTKVLSIA